MRISDWSSDVCSSDLAQYGDNRLPVVPKHQYRAELRLGTDTFSVTPNIEWTPKGAWTDYSNTTRAPGYTLLGLSAEAVVRDGVTLFLDARNLTGKKAVGDISDRKSTRLNSRH